MLTVTEGTALFLDLSFTDENNLPVTPTTASYRIQSQSGTEVLAPTAFTPAGPTHTLGIPGVLNAIVAAGFRYEKKLVSVTFTYGSGTSGSGEYVYLVRSMNLLSDLDADQCLLEGHLSDVGGINAPGVKVSVTPTGTAPLFLTDLAIKRAEKFTKSDANGFFSMKVLKSTPVRIRCSEVGYDKTTTLTGTIVNWKDIT